MQINRGIIRKTKSIATVKPKLSLKHFLLTFSVILLVLIAIPIAMQIIIGNYYKSKVFSTQDVTSQRVAIVFGAGLSDYGREPGKILEDRILTAVELYKSGKVQKIIMSGDNVEENYNEPKVMVDFAKQNGVRAIDLIEDGGGLRTYDTCLRAKAVYGLHEAILVTQEFHLPRALYTCNFLGLSSVGVSADRSIYQQSVYLQFRDNLALLLSFWELHIAPPNVNIDEKVII